MRKKNCGIRKIFRVLCTVSLVFICCLACMGTVSAATGTPGTCRITKVDNSKQNKIRITWNRVTGASGYKVYRSSSLNGKYTRIRTTGALSYTDKVKNGKTYYYKVRAFKKSGKKQLFGSYSAPRKATEIGKTWYWKVLKSKNAVYNVRYQDFDKPSKKKVKRSEFRYYKTVDFNGDGIQELLLSTCQPDNKFNNGNRALLLTYYRNKVRPLICFEGNGFRGRTYIDKGHLVLNNSGSNLAYLGVFDVRDGKLARIYESFYLKEIKKFTYKVNGKKVSYEKWRSENNKHWPSGKEVTYDRIK